MPLRTMRDDDPTINLAPMIDIVFLLIIFFMVGSHFSEQNHAERDMAVRVPSVADNPTTISPPQKYTINVFSDGNVQLDGRALTLAELESTLITAHRSDARTSVVIRGDSQSQYQSVADVIAVCRKSGIQDLNLAVRMAHAER